MAIQVDKAVCVHEAEIFRLVVGRTAGGDGFGNQSIYLIATITTEAEQNFDGFARVADRFGREVTKPGVRKQHDRNRIADDDARCSVVGELRIL